MTVEKIFIENNGEAMACLLYKPEKSNGKAIVLAHAFTGVKEGEDGAFVLLAEALCAKKFTVLAPDFRGSGESGGKFEDMTVYGEASDLSKAIGYLKGFRVGVLGASMGAAVTALAYDESVKSIVFWYPAIELKKVQRVIELIGKKSELEATGRILIVSRSGVEWSVGKKFVDEVESLELKPFLKKIVCPTLIITGDKDTVVTFTQSKKCLNLIKSKTKRIKIIAGSNHVWRGEKQSEYANEAIANTVEWFQKFM